MSEIFSGVMFAVVMFAGLLVAIEGGRRIRHAHQSRTGEAGTGLGTIESAVFGLMALILAFTFNSAASRFDSRRRLVIDEVNATTAAYQRLDLLASSDRQRLQQIFKTYVDARISLYKAVPDNDRVRALNEKSVADANEIWRQSVIAVGAAPAPAIAAQLLPAVGAMSSSALDRGASSFIHPPAVIYVMLAVIALLAGAFAGYAMGAGASRSWLHIIGFSMILAVTTYVIIDLEYPRLGSFQITAFDQMMVQLRAQM